MRSELSFRRAVAAVLVVAVVGWVAGPAAAEGGSGSGDRSGQSRLRAVIEALMDRAGIGSRAARPCGWMLDVSAQTLNVAAPDSHTNYFVQPYYLTPGSEIVVRGAYPFARYFSYVAYGTDGLPINGVSVHDTGIVPDAGSVNPFTTLDPPTDPAQRQYSMRITASPPPPGSTNTLAGLPAGQSSGLGFLVYRIYLPNDANDPAAGVPLPTITTAAGTHRTCTRLERAIFNRLFAPIANALVAASAPDPSTVTRGASLFRRVGNLAGLFPNPDNEYVAQATDWAPGTVLVIRGKAMTFPDTRHGGSTTEATDVRYWSMCSNELQNPYPVVSCASDDETVLDADGYYTYAVSMAQDRPANATASDGVTWLAWAARRADPVPPNTTYLRTMLPADGFDQAVQSVPVPLDGSTAEQNAAIAAGVMGDYYPVGVLCTKAQFEAGGPSSCFPAA